MALKPFGTMVTVNVTLRDDHAWALAMCLENLNYEAIQMAVSAWGGITDNDEEEYLRATEAIGILSAALAKAGYRPRG